MVLEYLESLFTAVWDVFESFECLGVSYSSLVTQGNVNLSSLKGQVRTWPSPVAPWYLLWTGDRLMLRCTVSLGSPVLLGALMI